MNHHHIYLIGMMGAGKSTIGRSLAQRLGRPFTDTDKVVVERTGVPIATIFEIEGEAAFRHREAVALESCAHAETPSVVSTGGGAPLREDNRRLMRETGTVVYLAARLEHLWRRLKNDRTRPLLIADDPRERLAVLLAERDPIYREAADVILETGGQSVSSLVKRAVDALRAHGITEGVPGQP